MDIQAYIESGIIESYVLGLATPEETAQLEKLRSQFVEVEEAINDFSKKLEKHAFESAVAPPPELKAKILAAIERDDEVFSQPASKPQQSTQPILIPISYMRTWRMISAASVMLLIVSAALNYYLYHRYSDKSEAYRLLLSERQVLQANNDIYQTQLKEWQTAAAMMADTTLAMVKMVSAKGTGDAATVFWNKQNKDVYVMVNRLPEPPHGKQYQLWALVNGKPVDAGVLNPLCSSVCKMKNIPKADAFAITLEREGGSPVPNLKALYVSGNI